MPRWPKRELKEVGEGGAAVAELEAEAKASVEEKTLTGSLKSEAKSEEAKKRTYVPWDFEKSSLPEPKLDKKGRIVALGEPRYYVNNTAWGGELIAVFKKRGVQRRLVRMLKDNKEAVEIRKSLRKLGIPGA